MSNAQSSGQDIREWRRTRAWEQHQEGWQGNDIAEALKVSAGAVSGWLKRARAAGVDALRRRPAPGPTPKLTAAQRAALPELLARGTEAYGCIGDVWTTKRVAVVIKLEQLPGYAPELNADEGVWNLLKRVELKNRCCQDLEELRWEVQCAIRRLQRTPHRIAACFRHAGLVP